MVTFPPNPKVDSAIQRGGYPSDDNDMAINDRLLLTEMRWWLPVVIWLLFEMVSPFLIWKGILPGSIRYLGELLLFGLAGVAIARMLLLDHFPKIVLYMLALGTIGTLVATFEGQPILATMWGLWLLFQYPMLGLYIYVMPVASSRAIRPIATACIAILAGQVCIQGIQFLAGEVPGDNLAGTFGSHGVGELGFFVFMCTAFALAKWLVVDDWKLSVFVITVGSVASALATNKMYPVALVMLVGLAALIYIVQRGALFRLIPSMIFFVAISSLFVLAYNSTVAESRGSKRIEEYFNVQTLNEALFKVEYDEATGSYHLGRGFALVYGWQRIGRDSTTRAFGFGLGARADSRSLNTSGKGLSEEVYDDTGTSILVLMQELGVVGLLSLGILCIFLCVRMLQFSIHSDNPDVTMLGYALFMLTVLWPFWLWYHRPLMFPTFSGAYWVLVGYMFAVQRQHQT